MKPIYSVLLLLAIVALTGCEETTTIVEYSSGLKGNLVGYVDLRSAWGSVDSNRGGVSVRLEGTALGAVSDSTGRWEIRNALAGHYTLIYSKPNYGSKKVYNVDVAGAGTHYLQGPTDSRPYLAEIAFGVVMHDLVVREFESEMIVSFRDSFYYDEDNNLHRATISDTIYKPMSKALFSVSMEMLDSMESSFTYMTFLFLSKDSMIAPTDPRSYSIVLTRTKAVYGYSTVSLDFEINRNDLIKAGLQPGKRVYCAAFGSTNFSYDKYLDYGLNKYVHVGLSPYRTEMKDFTFR